MPRERPGRSARRPNRADAIAAAAARLSTRFRALRATSPDDVRDADTPPPLVQAALELQRASEQIRREQDVQTRELVRTVLATEPGALVAVTVDAAHREALLLVDHLLLRVKVSRPSQALTLAAAQRRDTALLEGACFLDDNRVLLAFHDGEQTIPLVAEMVTRVHR